jgi:CrcB protein
MARIMTRLLLVASGGALGALMRYGVGAAAARWWPGTAWPWATFAVNVAGGLAMGLLAGWLALRGGAGQETIRLFAAVGLLGGFTTFSAFSLEAALLIERRQTALALGYVCASAVLAIAAVFAGLWLARRAFGVAA